MILWLSTHRMTVYATVKDGIVVECSPIISKFVGQHINNLRNWLKKQGGYREEQLHSVSRYFNFQ